ncbi:MAG: hypothetical protein KGH71_04840 [Candidatus Micrarchaeota archaeon]|nr:hypothetical protein [Candidatus Micrarchaeota archaeon]
MGSEIKERTKLTPQQINKGYEIQKRAREGDEKALVDFDKSFTEPQKEDLAKGLAFSSAKEFRGYLVSLIQSSEFHKFRPGKRS